MTKTVYSSVDLKKALIVLKSVMAFANRDWPRNLSGGAPVFEFSGNRLVYNSREGTTVGVDLPIETRSDKRMYMAAFTLKAALLARPGQFDVNLEESTINGIKYPDDGERPEFLPLNVNQEFGAIKCIVKLPLPDLINGVRLAEAAEDIRHYLKATCFDLGMHTLVATDGHRMHLANSATLPTIEPAVLERLSPLSKDRNYRMLLAGWQMNLLKSIQAAEICVGRFPERAKDLPALNGWVHPEPESTSLLFRAKGKFGFVIGKSIDGHFPDWTRVFLSETALETQREIALKASSSNWQEMYPRKMKIKASVAEDLRRYIRAEKAGKVSQYSSNPIVVVNLKRGAIQSADDAAMSIDLPVEMLDNFEYSEEFESAHLIGFSASYLADAIEYLGEAEWTVCKAANGCIGRNGALGAVVMPRRI